VTTNGATNVQIAPAEWYPATKPSNGTEYSFVIAWHKAPSKLTVALSSMNPDVLVGTQQFPPPVLLKDAGIRFSWLLGDKATKGWYKLHVEATFSDAGNNSSVKHDWEFYYPGRLAIP
jgi:hypothetical protein